jgi:2-amino-4-hydroxy-6-hydroxymethyldihydropteridine diphosphokinase
MAVIYLILGSNLNDREMFIQRAIGNIEQSIGTVLNKSSLYETEPWGYTDDKYFLNQIIQAETILTPLEILHKIKFIEQSMGRVRSTIRYSARQIDIDILFYDDLIVYLPELSIPHKEIQNRKFVLIPMAEIAEELVHPVLLRNIGELLAACQDKSRVHKYEPLKGV